MQGPGRRHEEGRPIHTHDGTEGWPWCVEHDPNGTCLGEPRRLPYGGSAWLEGTTDPKIVLWVGRPSPGGLTKLTGAETLELIGTLQDLADELGGSATRRTHV